MNFANEDDKFRKYVDDYCSKEEAPTTGDLNGDIFCANEAYKEVLEIDEVGIGLSIEHGFYDEMSLDHKISRFKKYYGQIVEQWIRVNLD